MTTPVNLNKARKAKAKAGKEQRAKENRARFGRTKSEKQIETARAKKQADLTDAHRLDPPDPEHG